MTIQNNFKLAAPISEDTIILGSRQEWKYDLRKFDKSYTIEFHPSAECIYACLHCQGYSSRNSWMEQSTYLKTKVVEDFFQGYDTRADKNIGMWRIIISGLCGEPLRNKEATLMLLEEGKKRGLSMGLSTSGILLDEHLNDILMNYNTPLDWVNVSLDSPAGREKHYEKLYSATHGIPEGKALSKVMQNLENLARTKVSHQAVSQINIDWIISDLNVKPESIEEDIVSTITYLNGIQGVNLLRLQFPFYFNPFTPHLSDEASTNLAEVLKKIQSGKIEIKKFRPDFKVWLRNNWVKRIKGVKSCKAASEYGPVIGSDGQLYHCPYIAAENFSNYNQHLKEINVSNLWDKITRIPALDTTNLDKCQVVCTNKNNFLYNDIVEKVE